MVKSLPLRKIRVYPSKVLGFERSCIVQEDGSFDLYFSRTEVKYVLETIQLSFRPIEAEDLEYFQQLDPSFQPPATTATSGSNSAIGMQSSVSYDNATEVDKEIQRSATYFPDSSLQTIISFLVGSEAHVLLKGQKEPITCVIVGLEKSTENTITDSGAVEQKDTSKLNILIPSQDPKAEKGIAPVLVSDIASITPLKQSEIERALNLVHLIRNQNFSKVTVHVKTDDSVKQVQPQVLVCRYALPNASTQDTHRVTINNNTGTLVIQTLSALMNQSSEDWQNVQISFYQMFSDAANADAANAASGSSAAAKPDAAAQSLETTLVAVLRGQSALMPITPQVPIAGRPVVLVDKSYSPASGSPMSAILLENNLRRRLKTGSVAVYDLEGNFLRDSSGFRPILSDLDNGESIVIPYANELSVSEEYSNSQQYKKINKITLSAGQLTEFRTQVHTSIYTIFNNSDRELDVVLKRNSSNKLTEKSRKPDYSLDGEHRYYLRVPANEKEQLTLEETSEYSQTYYLNNFINEETIEFALQKGYFTPEASQKLRDLLSLKAKTEIAAKKLNAVERERNNINTELQRLIGILNGFGRHPTHAQLQESYIQQIMEAEEKLSDLQQQQVELTEQVSSFREEGTTLASGLEMEVNLDGSEIESPLDLVDWIPGKPSFARKESKRPVADKDDSDFGSRSAVQTSARTRTPSNPFALNSSRPTSMVNSFSFDRGLPNSMNTSSFDRPTSRINSMPNSFVSQRQARRNFSDDEDDSYSTTNVAPNPFGDPYSQSNLSLSNSGFDSGFGYSAPPSFPSSSGFSFGSLNSNQQQAQNDILQMVVQQAQQIAQREAKLEEEQQARQQAEQQARQQAEQQMAQIELQQLLDMPVPSMPRPRAGYQQECEELSFLNQDDAMEECD